MAVDGNTRYMREQVAPLLANPNRPRRTAAIAADQQMANVLSVAENDPLCDI